MQTGHVKLLVTIRIILATFLLCMTFARPVVTQSSPAQPYDVYLPLLSKPYSPLPEIKNGDFELGNNGDWTEYSKIYEILIMQYNSSVMPMPHSGQWLAWLGGVNDEVSRLSQAVSLPPDGPLYLRYYYQADSLATSCNQDWMYVFVGTVELASLGLCEASNTSDWVMGTIDLSPYAGQAITLTFEVTTDIAGTGSAFFIDDVSLSRSP